MNWYLLLLVIHVLSAVCGLGAAFALPVLLNKPKTVDQANLAFRVNEGVEKMAKFGSIALLITGLIMGFLTPYLFKEIWFIASLVIYVLIQPIVAYLLPKKIKEQEALVKNHKCEGLPDEYFEIAKQMNGYNRISHLAAILLIILMIVKPF